jgi:hypothetical protein
MFIKHHQVKFNNMVFHQRINTNNTLLLFVQNNRYVLQGLTRQTSTNSDSSTTTTTTAARPTSPILQRLREQLALKQKPTQQPLPRPSLSPSTTTSSTDTNKTTKPSIFNRLNPFAKSSPDPSSPESQKERQDKVTQLMFNHPNQLVFNDIYNMIKEEKSLVVKDSWRSKLPGFENYSQKSQHDSILKVFDSFTSKELHSTDVISDRRVKQISRVSEQPYPMVKQVIGSAVNTILFQKWIREKWTPNSKLQHMKGDLQLLNIQRLNEEGKVKGRAKQAGIQFLRQSHRQLVKR